MGQARHPLSLALLLLALGLAGPLVGGCGSSSSEQSTQGNPGATDKARGSTAPPGAAAQACAGTAAKAAELRVTGVRCAAGLGVVTAWSTKNDCRADTSRPACTIGGYRCLSATGEHGFAVSCARPGRSISFIARRG